MLLCCNNKSVMWVIKTFFIPVLDKCVRNHKSFNNYRCFNYSIISQNTIEKALNDDSSLKILESQFPHPRGTLNNIMDDVKRNVKKSETLLSFSYKPVYSKSKVISSWTCNGQVQWPRGASFTATAKTKQEAAHIVSLRVLHWMQMQDCLKNNKPVFEETTPSKVHVDIRMDTDTACALQSLVSTYKNTIKPLIHEQIKNPTIATDLDLSNTKSIPESYKCRMINERNKILLERFYSRVENTSQLLPAHNYRKQILEAIGNNQVVIIKGETGCGKSTQVPQFILDDWVQKDKGSDCNILIGQPRRLSAISVAERVAFERNEELGDVVGYQVRFFSNKPRPPGGSILFCSTGILLRLFQGNPSMERVSHIILDEAHTRDVNTDMLLLLLKRILRENATLRVVIMSATINPELFKNYFHQAVVINIPGFTHPVASFFLDTFPSALKVRLKMREDTKPGPVSVAHDEVASVISWIHENKPSGAILCFLPGWQDIKLIRSLLQKRFNHSTCVILPLHARLTYEEQSKVFMKQPEGIRKIILATNVAETSITIDDISYVIDTGIHKEERLQKGITSIDNEWISQANVNQRKGRAGRVKSGECYHLYTRDKFNEMPVLPIPEIKRVPLHKTLLDLKIINENEKLREILNELPEPPDPKAADIAIIELVNLGILTDDDKLTSLGRRIVRFSTDPHLSKALVFSSIFRCVGPMLTIVSILSSQEEIFHNSLEELKETAVVKKNYHEFSDHIALNRLFSQWREKYTGRDEDELQMFCIENMLRENTMRLINRLHYLLLEQLNECGMIDKDRIEFGDDLAVNDDFIIMLLYIGFQNILCFRNWDIKKNRIRSNVHSFVTGAGHKAVILSDSVNSKNIRTQFFTYFHEKMSAIRRCTVIRETSALSPLAIALFPIKLNSSNLKMNVTELFAVNEQNTENEKITLVNVPSFKITSNQRDAEIIDNTRAVIHDIIQYFLDNQGYEPYSENYHSIRKFTDQLVTCLSAALVKSQSNA